MQLSIADRRHVTGLAYHDMDFRSRLERDPSGTLSAEIGRNFDPDKVELVREEEDWCFLMLDPTEIDAELPQPGDLRSVVENDVYALLRDRPELLDEATRDPKAFLARQLGVDTGDSGVRICHEAPGSTLIILPNIAVREELPDDLLDLVSAGGNSGAQGGDQTDPGREGGSGSVT